MPRTPWDFIELQREELLRRDAETLRLLARNYARLVPQFQRLLNQVERQIERALENGEPVHPNWLWRQERWRTLLMQAEIEAREFSRQAEGIIVGDFKDVAAVALDDSAARLRVAGPGVNFNFLPREAVDMIVAQVQARAPTGQLIQSIAGDLQRSLTQSMSDAIRDELVDGLAIGRNPREVAKRMVKLVGNDFENLTLHRAERIARTENMRTYRAAQNANYRANSDVLQGWLWISALNKFTCPACLALHMTWHPLEEDMSSHPGCRCTAIPHVRGMVVDLPDGETWLRQQLSTDPQRVREIMGSDERLELWRTGRVTLADLGHSKPNDIWGPSQQVTPLYRLRRIADGDEPSRPHKPWTPRNDFSGV